MNPRNLPIAVILLCAGHLFAPGGSVPSARADDGDAAAPWPIQTTVIDDAAIHGATFQSHNQKIVANRKGIFAVYLKNRNKEYTAQEWRLVGSGDGGATFRTLFQETAATNPPILETDAEDNLYVVRPDFVDHHAYLYRFPAKSDYREPVKTRIPRGNGGKYAMAIDLARSRLYYCSHNNTFHVIALNGEVLSSVNLFKPGQHAAVAYPYLCLGAENALYLAWTTVDPKTRRYWDIHVMRSRDGGTTWETLAGAPIAVPVVADEEGPADRITRDDEFEVSTWLAGFLPVESKLHFVYEAHSVPRRERYVRYDLKTGRKDLERQPEFRGSKLSLQGLDGFFAADKGRSLFCVMKEKDATRLACLRSDDEGQTWHDHAAGTAVTHPYAVGGCRTVTEDGWVIGTFTDAIEISNEPEGKSRVCFFKIKAAPPARP